MEPRWLGERIFSDGEFRAEHNRTDREHEDAREISSNGERSRTEKKKPLLPPGSQREIPVKRTRHHQGKKRTNARAGIGDIDGEFFSGGNAQHRVRRREDTRATADDIDADEVEGENRCLRHQHAEREGDVVVKEWNRPGKCEEDQRETKKQNRLPPEEKPNRARNHRLEGKKPDIVRAHALSRPEHGKGQDDEYHAEPRKGWRGKWFLINGIYENRYREGQDEEAVQPILASLGEV